MMTMIFGNSKFSRLIVLVIFVFVLPGMADSSPCRPKYVEGKSKIRPWLNKPKPDKPIKKEPSPQRREALRQFNEAVREAGRRGEARVFWNPISGFPQSLMVPPPGMGRGPGDMDEEEARKVVFDFLMEWEDLLGISYEDLEEPLPKQGAGGVSLEFKQRYKGIPVQGSKVAVYTRGGAVSLINSQNYYPDINLPVQPLFSAEAAVRTVEEFEEILHNPALVDQAQLVVLPDCGLAPDFKACEYHLAWKVIVSLADGALIKGFYVDSLTGNIVGEYRMEFC